MKQSILIAMTLIFAVSFSSYASSTLPPSVIAKTKLIKEKTFELRLANLAKTKAHISLTDMDKETIYFSDRIKEKNGYAKAINVKNLADGKYMLNIKSNGITQTQIIKITGDYIYFSSFK